MNTNKQPFFVNFFNGYSAIFGIIIAFMIGLIIGSSNSKISDPVVTNTGKDSNPVVTGVGETPEFLNKDVDFELFWDAWKTVSSSYVDQPVNETKLLYGAMAGMVTGLEDIHSQYFSPELNDEFLQELSGSFFGIGAEIAVKNNQLQVVAPLSDSPAQKSGVRAGDYIIAVNDEDMSGKSVDYAVNKIRGEKGTEVTLKIFRDGVNETKDIKIIRDEIKIVSVEWEKRDNQVAYIKLKYFNSDTGREFNKIAKQIAEYKPNKIILDVRNNPGGYLDVAVDIGSQFIEGGVIVKEKAADGTITEHKAYGKSLLKGIPVVVLINQGSASASEILAGALKDYGIGKIIGMKSYGKGSVQTLFDLKDGSSIKLTIAKWLTPNGNTIDKEGITPDIEVDLTTDDYNNDRDPQLDKALE